MLTEEVVAFPFGEGVGFADGRGLYGGKCPPLGGVYLSFELNWGKCRSRDLLLFRFAQNGWKVFPLGGLYVSFYLIWGKCRRRETLLSIEIQNGKEGILKN